MKAEVVTIPKKGKYPNIPQNRRPISLLSCLEKVYENILLNILSSKVVANNLVPEDQFGIMPGCSTTHQLLRLKKSTAAVFLDISKAYDARWHTRLIYKLIKMNVSGKLIKVIDSFLAHRSFRVKIDNAKSGWKPMLAGVQRGSTLSPIFYIHVGYTEVCPNRTFCLCG